MTDEELRAIEDRLAKATPGPWYSSNDAVPWRKDQRLPFDDKGAWVKTCPCDENADEGPRDAKDIVVGGAQDEQGGAVGVLSNEDAAFIAHARTDIAALLEEVRNLRYEIIEREEME